MAQPAEGFEGITIGNVEEAVERGFAEVVFPARGRGDFMCALGVGEGAKTAALEFFSERAELDFEVLQRGHELSVSEGAFELVD